MNEWLNEHMGLIICVWIIHNVITSHQNQVISKLQLSWMSMFSERLKLINEQLGLDCENGINGEKLHSGAGINTILEKQCDELSQIKTELSTIRAYKSDEHREVE